MLFETLYRLSKASIVASKKRICGTVVEAGTHFRAEPSPLLETARPKLTRSDLLVGQVGCPRTYQNIVHHEEYVHELGDGR